MADFMSLNTEEVNSAVNQISTILAEIDTRNKKCLELLNHHAEAAKGKNAVINTVLQRIGEEAANIKGLTETVDEITAELNRYAEKIAEANDASALMI